MAKKLATADEIRDEIERRLKALPGARGRSIVIPRVVPADRGDGVNWSLDGFSPPPGQVAATLQAIREVMSAYTLQIDAAEVQGLWREQRRAAIRRSQTGA